jgi:hypothetical protein
VSLRVSCRTCARASRIFPSVDIRQLARSANAPSDGVLLGRAVLTHAPRSEASVSALSALSRRRPSNPRRVDGRAVGIRRRGCGAASGRISDAPGRASASVSTLVTERSANGRPLSIECRISTLARRTPDESRAVAPRAAAGTNLRDCGGFWRTSGVPGGAPLAARTSLSRGRVER